jgi:hypothetical protein
MNYNTIELEPYIQKQVDAGLPGTDILHGALKNMMYEAEQMFIAAQDLEDKSGEAIDSMERKFWDGYLEALTNVYSLTYNLSFAIQERTRNNGR